MAVLTYRLWRVWATNPVSTRVMPRMSHGRGLRYWSHPALEAVCQQVVPGPCRCTYATQSSGRPAPVSQPDTDLWRLSPTVATSAPSSRATGAVSTPRERELTARAPTAAQAQNQTHVIACRGWTWPASGSDVGGGMSVSFGRHAASGGCSQL